MQMLLNGQNNFYLIEDKESVLMSFFSVWGQVQSGIPQRSILAPLSFIIFTNKLAENCSSGFEFFLYANDAK